jgi:hypothetical protein
MTPGIPMSVALTDAQKALLATKVAFAKDQNIEACVNVSCGFDKCECGSKCTCGISKKFTCDPCVEFKKQKAEEKKKAEAAQNQE